MGSGIAGKLSPAPCDPATPPPHAEKIAAGVAGPVRLEIVPGAAHLASVERPELVSRLLREFWS